MLAISGAAKIFFHREAIDLRKGFEGLSTIIASSSFDPLISGAYFVFLNRAKSRMKVLYWDSDGLAIWHKRLEAGSFSTRDLAHGKISRRDFLMLLEGITPKRLQTRYTPA